MQFKINANRTHYIKYSLSLDKDLSIRFFFLWQDKASAEKRYILKHHSLRTSSIIEADMAKSLIKKYCCKKEEIVAFLENGIHKKIIISDTTINQVEGDIEDIIKKSSSIIQEWQSNYKETLKQPLICINHFKTQQYMNRNFTWIT